MNRNRTLRRLISLVWLAGCLGLLGPAEGQQRQSTSVASDPPVDFVRDVQPILTAHCHQCHGASRQESNYRLDVREVALGTADFGDPPIVPGDASSSPLIELVSASDAGSRMPPEDTGAGLSAQEIQVLRRWVDEGAAWPDEVAGEVSGRAESTHWSFQPLADPVPPAIETSEFGELFAHSPIDRFVAARLAENGLRPSSPADRTTLIRRLYLVMHGLQPESSEVEAFLNNDSETAWEQLVDEVLASPRYGERWARHWLDVVRFGESTGYEVNRDRPNAWYYRDYVINSLNEDKPWSDFIVEQLAGDAVGVDEATGFLTGGPFDVVTSPDVNLTLMQRQDELADYVHTTATAFLGMTAACARCHNHKFDPISQQDYYALQAVFAGVRHGERKLASRAPPGTAEELTRIEQELADKLKQLDTMRAAAPTVDIAGLLPPVNSRQNIDTFDPVTARFVRFEIRRTNRLEPCLDELEVFRAGTDDNVALAAAGATASSSGDYEGNPIHQLDHINDGRYGNNYSWISATSGTGWICIELTEPVEIDRVVWGRDREAVFDDRLATDYRIEVSLDGESWSPVFSSAQRAPFLIDGREVEDAFLSRLTGAAADEAANLYRDIVALREEAARIGQSVPDGYVGMFRDPEPVYRLHRGDPMAPREPVAPDTLEILGSLQLPMDAPEQHRRLELARSIAAEDNPLTARVIVNRVWQYHFGTGIVATPSDFGNNGIPPTHPELLDWLARRFMENGWSLKWLHREILLSATWQQSSHPRPEALAVDADCRWLWRFPPRRLEAEAIRDCVLQLSGKLNLQAGGPGFLLFRIDRENVHHYFPLEQFGPDQYRRMIYMTKIRQEQDSVFGVFDCPDGGQTIPERGRSTTPLQALNLLNSPFMLEQAGFLAERLESRAGADVEQQIRLAFQLVFSRQPSAAELEQAVSLVRQYGMRAFCRALFNANEFLFLS